MATVVRENDDGRRLSLQRRGGGRGRPDPAFRRDRRGRGLGVPPAGPNAMAFYWVDRNLGFALAGPLDRERLLALAHAVYQQYQRG